LFLGTTILPAFFGMNLSSRLSDQDPYVFYAVREQGYGTRSRLPCNAMHSTYIGNAMAWRAMHIKLGCKHV
jgi:hypothetical protein